MKPPETIRVTAEHIERGQRHESDRCPIALAIEEQWSLAPESVNVWTEAMAYVDGDLRRAKLPPAAFEWLNHFDDERPVEPFEFELKWSAPYRAPGRRAAP